MTEVQADDHFAEAGKMVQTLAGWTPSRIILCDDCLHDRLNPDEVE